MAGHGTSMLRAAQAFELRGGGGGGRRGEQPQDHGSQEEAMGFLWGGATTSTNEGDPSSLSGQRSGGPKHSTGRLGSSAAFLRLQRPKAPTGASTLGLTSRLGCWRGICCDKSSRTQTNGNTLPPPPPLRGFPSMHCTKAPILPRLTMQSVGLGVWVFGRWMPKGRIFSSPGLGVGSGACRGISGEAHRK